MDAQTVRDQSTDWTGYWIVDGEIHARDTTGTLYRYNERANHAVAYENVPRITED